MGQVPDLARAPFGIVGSGRVARHFYHYFSLLGIPVRLWCRRLPGLSPPEALVLCETILVLLPDDAIEPFVDKWPSLKTKRLVHCSGSLAIPGVTAAHPLMTFGPALYDLADYTRVPFVLDAGGPTLAELLPGLPNPTYVVDAGDRPYYHALCVMAGNFSTLLWQKLLHEFEGRLHMPASAAFPYLERVTANLMEHAGDALTGPLARGDRRSLTANLKALDGDPYHEIYRAFVRMYEHRA